MRSSLRKETLEAVWNQRIKPSSTPSRETNKRTIQRSGPLWEHPPHSTGVSWQSRNVLVCTLCRRRRLTATLRSNTEGENIHGACYSERYKKYMRDLGKGYLTWNTFTIHNVNAQISCARSGKNRCVLYSSYEHGNNRGRWEKILERN